MKPDGYSFEGEWVNDQIEGQGILTKNDGTKIIGVFKGGSAQGKGIVIYPDG